MIREGERRICEIDGLDVFAGDELIVAINVIGKCRVFKAAARHETHDGEEVKTSTERIRLSVFKRLFCVHDDSFKRSRTQGRGNSAG